MEKLVLKRDDIYGQNELMREGKLVKKENRKCVIPEHEALHKG